MAVLTEPSRISRVTTFRIAGRSPVLLRTLAFALLVGATAACGAARTAPAPAPAAPPRIDSNPTRWEPEIAAFEAADREQAPPRGAVLFLGSSSIRLWETLAEDFPGIATIRRGFGGSQLADATHHAGRIVLPYEPATIVLYAGDNDLWAGATPQQVLADFERFVAVVHGRLPETRILFLAIKPSTARWSMIDRIRETNALVRERASRDPRLGYVDVFTPMLGADGLPRSELLVEDGLHLSAAGYALWRETLAPFLR